MTNKEIIQQFYSAFAEGDAESMVKHYSNDIKFNDPAFGLLQGEDARNMWRMLIRNGNGTIRIVCTDVDANEKTGSAKWTAKYIFSKTGRTVINNITAHFEFQDGKITRHTDEFDLWKWSQQAFGWKGYLLGRTTFMKNKIREYAIASLKKYNASK